MKLYTEEQVRVAMSLSFIKDTIATENKIIDSLKFIELPSDEEIYIISNTESKRLDSQIYESGFRDGAKWMKEQVKQQADGH